MSCTAFENASSTFRPRCDEQMKKLPKYLQSFVVVLAVTAGLIVVDYLRLGTIPSLYDLRFLLGILGFTLLFHFLEKK
jgi:hypothetical protein